MRRNIFDDLLKFLSHLDQAQLSYTLAHYRDEALMVIVDVPGERWEVEFLSDGTIEVERFISNGEIEAEDALSELFAVYAEQESDELEALQDAAVESFTQEQVVIER